MKIVQFKTSPLSKWISSPKTALVTGFAAVILVGALLLCLPWSQHGKVGFLDALFTSTSAVCVTGLVVVDTGTDFTPFGQVVILVLIQVGAIGIMTFAGLTFQFLGRRMSLQSQAVLQDTFFQRDMAGEFKHTFRSILLLTLSIEAAGALLIWLLLLPKMAAGPALFSAVFHSISAFCNAGFSIYSDSLIGLRGSTGILIVMALLIISGGLGYIVLTELWTFGHGGKLRNRARRPGGLSMHGRLVLWMSGILIVGGCVGILAFGLTTNETNWYEKLVNAAFQSVTARTAGFNSVDIGRLPETSLFILIVLMFIGGSPASCAGGVKTTTTALWAARIRATLRGERDVHVLGRRVPWEQVGRADLLVALAICWNLAGIMLLLTTEAGLPEKHLGLVFEQISAFGTVGLSTGVTPGLSTVGKIWIIATMFVGRLGPLTIAMWMVPMHKTHVSYPKGTVMIG